jgi:two-component sensor histidine kinase
LLNNPAGLDLRGVAERALAQRCASDLQRLHLLGDDVLISQLQADILRVVLQELLANALEHGALTRPAGRIELRWRVDPAGKIQFAWTEIGIGRLVVPDRIGRGTFIIGRAVEGFTREFNGGGMVCRFHLQAA